MTTYKLTLEYDGTRYRGWQAQKNTGRTVAAARERAASEVCEEPVRVHGAGRTDAGVHALAQVAHFQARAVLSSPEVQYGINDRLPPDINVLAAEHVPDGFHARHDAVSRTYVYRISKRRTAFEKPFVWWVKDRLDVEPMRAAASLFAGKHDFSSFCENPEGQTSTLVVVESCALTETEEKILVRVRASHFLWKMIRRLVGTLVEVGRGNLAVEDVRKFLETRSSRPARWTAPPSGLFLESVEYAPARPAPKSRRPGP
ncbi:MAG: tRNA pseudouridine(38-40) synthase TruA [Thermoanaerobaculia bacterium]